MTGEKAIRTALTLGPILACIGIAGVAMAPKESTLATLASSAVLVGVATAVWGTHKYGRLGVDAPVEEPTEEEDRSPSTPG